MHGWPMPVKARGKSSNGRVKRGRRRKALH
jgi:hypothetical protein